MKRILAFVLSLTLTMMALSACGDDSATEASPPPTQTPPASSAQPSGEPQPSEPPSEEPSEAPELSDDPDGGLEEAHEDVQGDMETHYTYHDEENELMLSYPSVFAKEGELDQGGYVHFPSRQTEGSELVYWVVPNTHKEEPADFIKRVSAEDKMELEGNAVIAKVEEMDQETGERRWSVCYWVVDVDTVVNVSIICDTPEYADVIYEDLQNAAVYVESVAGIEF